MDKTIKMSKKNEDGKVIVKEVPENLYSLYKGIGWVEVKEKETLKESFSSKNSDGLLGKK